ncbi:MAG TPA: DUF6588 family protein [Candidatus Eisenbacteria bacterium]|jgi:hypothetical protein
MSRSIACTVAFAAFAASIVGSPAGAQLQDNLGALSGDNAKGYLGPLPKALSGTLNAAIFQTGNVPKASVDFTIGVRLMGVAFDDEDRTYRPTDPPGFTSNGPVDAPTVIGDEQAVAQSGQGGTTLYHPGGFDIGEFAVAVPQLTIGSVMGTRAVVRWISLDLGDSDFGRLSLFGFGAQHSISQYFPGLPVDLAAGVFYQSFRIDDDLVDTKALHVDVTGSRSLGMLQPYVGVGFDRFDMEAEYDDSNSGQKIRVDFDTESDAHLTLGALLHLPVVKLHGELNVASTNGAAIGLSFGR